MKCLNKEKICFDNICSCSFAFYKVKRYNKMWVMILLKNMNRRPCIYQNKFVLLTSFQEFIRMCVLIGKDPKTDRPSV